MRASPASLILVAAAAAEAGAIDGAYHGTIGKLEVFARLEQAADGALRGRYFYARVGRDIELDGRVDGEQIAFVEHVAGKSTGRFSGRLGPGAIAGTWSSGSKKLPFSLAAVPRAELQPILVARKNGSTAADLPGGKRCKRDILYPELFGLVDAGVEQALNSKLRPEAAPCGATGEHSVQYQVHLNRSGILSLSLGASGYGEGAAHPYSELRSFNVVTRTGRMLEWKDVFKPGSGEELKAKLEPLIQAALTRTPGLDASAGTVLREALPVPGADFFLEDKGVRFNAWGTLPHAWQALAAEQDFFLSYDQLRPVLAGSGDAARVWTR
jgi:hypothetical protein